MNGKCTMDNMNDNMHLIGILLLSFILIVVIIYFYTNVMQKHCDIVEEFVSKAQINEGNDYGAGYTDYSEINSLDKNTIENNLIQTRKCQVYFVGAKDRNKAYPLLWREINSDQISKYVLLDNSQLSNFKALILLQAMFRFLRFCRYYEVSNEVTS